MADRAEAKQEAIELVRRALDFVDGLGEYGAAADLQSALDELTGVRPPFSSDDVAQALATPEGRRLLDRILAA